MQKNIGIDITNLDPDYYGGSDTYSNGLINGLINSKTKHKFQIYVSKKYFENRKFLKKKNVKVIVFRYSIIEFIILKFYNRIVPYISILLGNFKFELDYIIRNFVNRDLTNLINKNSEYLFSPNVLLPSYNLKVKSILNIQDIQHIHFPDFFSYSENLRRKYLYYNSLKFSDKLVCSSNFIKKDIKKNFNLKNKEIKVIEEGINLNETKKFLKIKKYKKFFFFPAQLWKHKNHLLVIKAFDLFNKSHDFKYTLIICGKKFETSKNILNKIKRTKNCHYLGVISKKLLFNLYRSSIATISPALYESSSLTILEALACNSKVIASNTEPNLERKKFGILYFKKNSYISLKNQFEICLKKKKIKNNKKLIKKFDWVYISKKWIKLIN
tara:strand:+ start:2326 stop:3477 length:1152 start_codon:yes stop_codon:yes gene_type:complete